jgi:hypothetical protein
VRKLLADGNGSGFIGVMALPRLFAIQDGYRLLKTSPAAVEAFTRSASMMNVSVPFIKNAPLNPSIMTFHNAFLQ